VSVLAALNSVVSRNLVLAIVGGVVVVALLAVGMLLQRRSTIESLGSVDLGQEKETNEKRVLLDEGNKFLQAGKPVEAREKFLEPLPAGLRDGAAERQRDLSQELRFWEEIERRHGRG